VVYKKKSIVRPDLVDNQEEALPISGPLAGRSSKPKEKNEKEASKSEDPPTRKEESEIKGLGEKHAKEQASKQTSR